MKNLATVITCVAIATSMFIAGRGCGRCNHDVVEVHIDTLWLRDTLRDTVLIPVERYVLRIDTVFLTTPGDTVLIEAALPVERKIYATDNYRAVVEGYRPSLVEMELYRNTPVVTRQITRTTLPKKWSLGIQAGWGLTPRGAGPYLGVGVQYRLTKQ